MKPTVDAVLMASGLSRRFGQQNKLLVPFMEKPLARYTLELVCGSGLFNNVHFIYNQEEVAELATKLPVTLLYNKDASNGAFESIRLGAAQTQADYCLFLTCDQPFLTKQTLQAILSCKKDNCIIIPQYKGKNGNPVLFSRPFFKELASLSEGEKGKTVINRHQEQQVFVEIKDKWSLFDIDTPEDLRIAEQYAANQAKN